MSSYFPLIRKLPALYFIIALFFLVPLLPGCKNKPTASGDAALRRWFGAETDSLLAELHILDSLVKKPVAVPVLQQQFSVARSRYKHIEGVVEYYFQGLTRRINGPALPDIKPEDNQVWPPHGFQVAEQYLYSPFPDSLRPLLSNEIKLLQTDLKFVQANLAVTDILPRHVQEIVQHQIIRIGTLGITGFDAPLSKLSLPESGAALAGLQTLLESYAPETAAAGNQQFAAAQNYLAAHKDFDAFDRMVFLRQYLAPLSTSLAMQKQNPADSVFKKPFAGTLAMLLQGRGFDPDYYTNYASAKSNPAKVALGQQLFYDTRLSKSGSLSCAGCHRPERSFTDGLPKAGNKIHGGSLPRNTPTLLYASLQRDQFYDHRSLTLEDQVNEVMDNKDEFGQQAVQIAKQLGADAAYKPLFAAAFGTAPVGGYEVRNALAAYVRTLNPFRSCFDAYMQGSSAAMNREELQGFNLFMGKAKCATCHFIPLFNGTVPPWYSKSESEIIGVPQKPLWSKAVIDRDEGRYKWNQLEELRYAFKTPTVRNSAATAPYMHNGVYKTLDDVVEFYHKGGGKGIGISLPFQSLPFDSLQLNGKEKKAIVAFLHTLTDKM
jgi:cytochrome c peroxidase